MQLDRAHAANICLKKNAVVVSPHLYFVCFPVMIDFFDNKLNVFLCNSLLPSEGGKSQTDFLLPCLKPLHLAVMLAAAQISKPDI